MEAKQSFIHSCSERNAVLRQPHWKGFYLHLNYRSLHYLDIVLDSVDAEEEEEDVSFGVHDDEQVTSSGSSQHQVKQVCGLEGELNAQLKQPPHSLVSSDSSGGIL